MAKDPAVLAHQEWLGYVQPVGLVVSIPAMLDANVRINQNVAPDHRRFLEALPSDSAGEPIPEVVDFPQFAHTVLGWSASDLYGAPGAASLPDSLEISLPDYNETLRPTYSLREFEPAEGARQWILLMKVLPMGIDFDAVEEGDSRHWQASPQAKFERLLRQNHTPIGLLFNGRQIRLVYAPEKELSGHVTFKLVEMAKVAGRPIFAAFHMLLSAERLYSVGERERLPAILENSRKYQNVVSTQLASQVLQSLYELLRGFQAADDQAQGQLLHDVLARDPDHVYRGLLTTLLRMVFVLYAEDRGLLSTDPVFANNYSITGLYERLRIDDGRYPDTMDQRYGAWAQLLTLFRLIYRGGSHAALRIPAREGYLFDPDRYLFLEGRHTANDDVSIPRVPDGVLFRVLSKLMLLDGERISYRTLAVEQIGSVYEAIMGFELHVASGPSIAIKPVKRHGAPTTINLEALLATPAKDRLKRFTEETDQKLTGKAVDLLKAATTVNDLMTTLDRKIDSAVTPGIVAKGAMIFQPSNERRRSGSHYTPSSLTDPIVEAALAPVLKQLGDNPTPAQILSLKVCDPAMGSGAFLVEACRQLGSELSRAWHAHNDKPPLPIDEDEPLHAQRQIAQRCLYGVDKNPMATDLAKLSLWLATLAKHHPFTFLDHSLRAGDSLVGLTRKQIAAFHWSPSAQMSMLEQRVRRTIETVSNYRQQIFAARDNVPYAQLKQKLDAAEDALSLPRQVGDAVVAAFFAGEKLKDRENIRARLSEALTSDLRVQNFVTLDGPIDEAISKLKTGAKGIHPFHWELEFPEVFAVDERGEQIGGFDLIVGNPPFAGKNTLIAANQGAYPDWLKAIHAESHGNSDLVAHFFRRAFTLLRTDGCLGLIATNTIGQGDTRSTGLRWICNHGGTVYRAIKRLKWPGEAAVIVSVVHVCKGQLRAPFVLNGRSTNRITAFLFHAGGNDEPSKLRENVNRCFIGSYVLGMGFTFDDADASGFATPISEMQHLILKDARNAERIFPYLGGEEINNSPSHAHRRYVINFENFPLERISLQPSWAKANDEQRKSWLRLHRVPLDYPLPVASDWPDLLQIVVRKVKPDRLKQGSIVNPERWWMFARSAADLKTAAEKLDRVIACSRIGNAFAFTVLPKNLVLNEKTVVFATDHFSFLSVIQSHVHEVWVRFFSATLKDDLQYTPSDCFESFPFPNDYLENSRLEDAGRTYFDFRAELMIRNDQGLTKTYNRFHDPNEDSTDILRLRELHAAMDRAVLDAYGWQRMLPICQFFPEFDDEEEEDEGGRPKKKKYRYRWPEDVHDEVLARLLDLNRQRALEEGQILVPERSTDSPWADENLRTAKKSSRKSDVAGSPASLFATIDEEG
jgi:N-6 DNA Methylase